MAPSLARGAAVWLPSKPLSGRNFRCNQQTLSSFSITSDYLHGSGLWRLVRTSTKRWHPSLQAVNISWLQRIWFCVGFTHYPRVEKHCTPTGLPNQFDIMKCFIKAGERVNPDGSMPSDFSCL